MRGAGSVWLATLMHSCLSCRDLLHFLLVRLQLWLSKVPGLTPVQIDERMERGSYTVFDLGQWGQVLI